MLFLSTFQYIKPHLSITYRFFSIALIKSVLICIASCHPTPIIIPIHQYSNC